MNSNVLQRILLSNSIFSMASVVIILAGYERLEQWGIPRLALIIVAVGVFIFGIFVFLSHLTHNFSALKTVITTILDLSWFFISIPLLIFTSMSSEAKLILGVISAIVFGFAVMQIRAMNKIIKSGNKRTNKITIRASRIVSADFDSTWDLISDLNGYEKYAEKLKFTDYDTEQEEILGSMRHCGDYKNNSWDEKVTQWEASDPISRKYEMLVNTQDPNYPLPFSYVKGLWTVKKVDQDHSDIQLEFKVELKVPKIFSVLTGFPVYELGIQDLSTLLDNWENTLIRAKSLNSETVLSSQEERLINENHE